MNIGYFFIYVATSLETIPDVKKMVIEEISKLKKAPVDKQLLINTKKDPEKIPDFGVCISVY